MLAAQSQCQLKPWVNRPPILGIDTETASIHRCRLMKRIILLVYGGAAVEEIHQTWHDFGRHELGCIIVGNVVAPEVCSKL